MCVGLGMFEYLVAVWVLGWRWKMEWRDWVDRLRGKRKEGEGYRYAVCGEMHAELPMCFGFDAPWRMLVPEEEFGKRVELNDDLCVVDGKEFFVRGHIEIPLIDGEGLVMFSVWSSLSQKSYDHMCERWEDEDRWKDEPYFGWLCCEIPVYPSTMHLKLMVHSREVGATPFMEVEPTEHPLSVDQREGISVARWHEMARKMMGG